nr:molting-inhibiting hormone [Gecarcinus lateralis]
MMSRAESRFASQRTWLVAVVVLAVLWSIGVQRAAAAVINDECPNVIGNRDIFKKVDWICEDCANIFRIDGLATLCR